MKVRDFVRVDEDAVFLTTIPGVSYYTALLIAEVGDVDVFHDLERLCFPNATL